MMWDGFNKRKFPRLSTQCEIIIRPDTEPTPITTTTENIGAGGVCVILDSPLERFADCRVRIDLGSKYPKIDCAGKVVWIVPTRDVKSRSQRYDTGIEFADLEYSGVEAIRDFISHQPVPPAPPKPTSF